MTAVRDTYMRDYGIDHDTEQKILKYCKNARGEAQKEILMMVQMANKDLANYLFFNITTGIGYDNMSKIFYVPVQKKDFQGYRRLAIHKIYDWLRLSRRME